MGFGPMIKTARKFVTDNSTGILTGLGVAGVVTTAVLTGKATLQSTRILANEAWIRDDDNNVVEVVELDNRQILSLIWREFIPPAAVMSITIAAIISANSIGTRRAAAIAAAFKISETLGEEYRDKVVEHVGKKAEEDIRAKLATDRMERNPVPNSVIIIGGDNTLFYDTFSGRYFKSEMEDVRRAMNNINAQINNSYYACLTDLYHALGLDATEYSDTLGWNSDELLAFNFTATIGPHDKPAIAIEYNKTPIVNYDRVS